MNDRKAWVLALDTATNTIVVAAGSLDGAVLASDAFAGRYRHSQELIPAINRLAASAALRLGDLAGVVVGTGPGAFTGLRVGLAIAKTLAHELACPVVGITTPVALIAAVEGASAAWLPSGTHDRLRIDAAGAAELIRDPDPALVADGDLAVDLEGRAPEAALDRGRAAVAALPASLLRLGSARLAAGDVDDPERLVPAYAIAPRGAPPTGAEGGMAWSRDPR